jgi:two-component system, OmpR family, response regulator
MGRSASAEQQRRRRETVGDLPKTILIVEDDGPLRRLLSLALRLAGFMPREAENGLEAIRILEWSRPDALVLDLGLPGLDGFAVLDEIAAHAEIGRLPIIIVTGSQEPLTHVHSNCVLRKPVTPNRVVATVEKCLRESSGKPP